MAAGRSARRGRRRAVGLPLPDPPPVGHRGGQGPAQPPAPSSHRRGPGRGVPRSGGGARPAPDPRGRWSPAVSAGPAAGGVGPGPPPVQGRARRPGPGRGERHGPSEALYVRSPAKPPVLTASSASVSCLSSFFFFFFFKTLCFLQRNSAVSICPRVKPIKAPLKSYLRMKIYKSLVQIPLGNSCKIKTVP